MHEFSRDPREFGVKELIERTASVITEVKASHDLSARAEPLRRLKEGLGSFRIAPLPNGRWQMQPRGERLIAQAAELVGELQKAAELPTLLELRRELLEALAKLRSCKCWDHVRPLSPAIGEIKGFPS